MLRVFAAKEVPWVVGLIAGMLAWTVTHIVDRLTSAPLISFQLEQPLNSSKGSDGKTVLAGSFIVRNLTRETAFSHARFQVYAGVADNPEGEVEPIEGSFIFGGESFKARVGDVDEKGQRVLTYDVPEMQPRQAWRLSFRGLIVEHPVLSLRMGPPPASVDSIPPAPPVIEADASPTPAGSPDGPKKEPAKESEASPLRAVQLVKANWATYVVEKEIAILAILACVFTAVLLLFLFILRVPEPAPGPPGPPPGPLSSGPPTQASPAPSSLSSAPPATSHPL